MVPKTEIDGPGNAVSAGPACVPADLSTNPRHIAAIPTGITRPPHRTKRSPTPTHIARHNGQRQRASPDESGSKHGDCGKIRSERELLEAIVFPSATFVRGFEPFAVKTKTGEELSGILRKDAPDEIVIATGPETEQHIARRDIVNLQPSPASPMPPGYESMLTKQELADLVAFLKSRS